MSTRAALVPTDRANQLVGAVIAGKSQRQAAKLLNIPPSTADYILKKHRKTGSVNRRRGQGRNPIITPRMERLVIKTAKQYRRMPLAEVGQHVRPKISVSSVRRILDKVGLHRRKARKVIYLKPETKEKRLQWARNFEDWTEDEWALVIWSDEVYVVLGDRAGSVWVTRTADEEFDEACVVPKFKQSNLRIMCWSCIMKDKKGPIIILEYPGGQGGGMTAKRYQEQVLRPVVIDFYRKAFEERDFVLFEQDGAPSHTAKSTIRFLEQHDIETMPQPPSSPDVVPLESLWHILKRHIRAREHLPTTLDELRTAVKEAWDLITIEEVNHYVASMQDRVQAVIKAKGGHTKY